MIGIGSRGDLEPYLALGEALHRRGHRVRVATHGDAAELVRDCGLDYRPLPGSASAFLARPELAEAMRRAPTISRLRRVLKRSQQAGRAAEATSIMRQYVDRAVAGADLAVCGPSMEESLSVRPLSVPRVLVSWYPVTPTGAFVAPGAPDLPLGSGYRRMTHYWVNWLVRRQLRSAVAAGRRLHGLRGSPRPSASELTFYLVSRAVLPDPGWPKSTVLTGPWARSAAAPDDGPPAYWWDDGPPPVIVSFGSLWSVVPEVWADYIADAVQSAGHRVVMVGGPAIRTSGDRRQCSTLDFSVVLPKAHALVHHGGFGTGSSALRAGVPQVITPLFIDHPWWARQMHRLGVAPAPVALGASDTNLSEARKYVSRLQSALGQVDDSMRSRAMQVAEDSFRDGGVDEAVELIEQWKRQLGPEERA